MKTTKTALFEGLTDEEYSVVSEKLKFSYKSFSRDEEVFVYGKDDGKLLYLAEGVCETIRTDEDGTQALIERYSQGAVFGFASATGFSGRDYVAVIAKTKCVVGICEIAEIDFSSMPYVFLRNFFLSQEKRLALQIKRTGVLLGRTIRDKLMFYFRGNHSNLCIDFRGGKQHVRDEYHAYGAFGLYFCGQIRHDARA